MSLTTTTDVRLYRSPQQMALNLQQFKTQTFLKATKICQTNITCWKSDAMQEQQFMVLVYLSRIYVNVESN